MTALRDVYKGELVNGAFEGYGEMLYADAAQFTGSWRGGKRHGRGIFTGKIYTIHYTLYT